MAYRGTNRSPKKLGDKNVKLRSHMFSQDYYKILGLDSNSSAEEIRKAINIKLREVQAKVNDPDKDISKKASNEMEILLEARRTLLNPEKRKGYDKQIKKLGLPGFKETPKQKELALKKPILNHSIALLLDTSGSMYGEKIGDAKEALGSFLKTVNLAENEVALVTFGDQISWMDGLTQNISYIQKEIDALDADGSTPVMQAIKIAHEEVLKKGRAKPVMVIATDGAPTDSTEEEILAYTTPVKKNGTWIITIGIGDDVNEEFLKRLASSPEDYHFAKASFELKEIYKKVVSGLVQRKGTRET